jgi:hypothetical protein
MLVVEQEDQTGDGEETVMDGEEQMGHEMDQVIPLLLQAMHSSSGSTAPYYSFVGGW